jgi:hypothetical protein
VSGVGSHNSVTVRVTMMGLPDTVAAPFGPYSHAVEVPEGSRLLGCVASRLAGHIHRNYVANAPNSGSGAGGLESPTPPSSTARVVTPSTITFAEIG